MMEGKLVILSGPSGVGKDSLIEEWSARNPKVRRVVAYTTRPPRTGEKDGVDYHFVTLDKFHALAHEGAFLEYKEVHGNWYATPLRDMNSILDKGMIAILKIDVEGAKQVIPLRPDAITLFILPPSLEELERRIRSRATDSEEAIAKRLTNALREIEGVMLYQHQVVNADLHQAVDAIEAIVNTH